MVLHATGHLCVAALVISARCGSPALYQHCLLLLPSALVRWIEDNVDNVDNLDNVDNVDNVYNVDNVDNDIKLMSL